MKKLGMESRRRKKALERKNRNRKKVSVHIPNAISAGERFFNILASVVLFIYGGYGILKNDLYVPNLSKYGHGKGMHFDAEPAWIMFGAMLCGCLIMLSVVMDHYDKRKNEYVYRRFARRVKYLAWGLFAAAVAMQVFRKY